MQYYIIVVIVAVLVAVLAAAVRTLCFDTSHKWGGVHSCLIDSIFFQFYQTLRRVLADLSNTQ